MLGFKDLSGNKLVITLKRDHLKRKIQTLCQQKIKILNNFTASFDDLEEMVHKSLQKSDDLFLSECNKIDLQLTLHQNYCYDVFYELNFSDNNSSLLVSDSSAENCQEHKTGSVNKKLFSEKCSAGPDENIHEENTRQIYSSQSLVEATGFTTPDKPESVESSFSFGQCTSLSSSHASRSLVSEMQQLSFAESSSHLDMNERFTNSDGIFEGFPQKFDDGASALECTHSISSQDQETHNSSQNSGNNLDFESMEGMSRSTDDERLRTSSQQPRNFAQHLENIANSSIELFEAMKNSTSERKAYAMQKNVQVL